MTLIRYFGNFPCPRCLIPKSDIHRLGTMHDEAFRREYRRFDNPEYRSKIKKARKLVYLKGKGIMSKDVEKILSSQSLVPVHVIFFSPSVE